MKAVFTAGEASRLAGFSKPWMLAHLEREGIFVREHVTDRRHGKVRKYTFADIVILRAINRLLALGARPARIKSLLANLSMLPEFRGSQRSVLARLSKVEASIIIGDGAVYFVRSDQEVVDLLKGGQLAFGFMVHVQAEIRPVCDVVNAYTKQRVKHWKVDQPRLEALCLTAGI
jgi:DNA-binding transcriptional MerR regulator